MDSSAHNLEEPLVTLPQKVDERKKPQYLFVVCTVRTNNKILRRFPLNVRAVSAKIKLPK